MSDWTEGYKAATKASIKGRYEWSLSSGYRPVRYGDEWLRKPRNASYKDVTLYSGKKVKVPDADFEDYIGHMKTQEMLPDIEEYIGSADYSQEFPGVGHITNVAYSPKRQLMEVSFKNGGAVVVYFRVPKEVYSELLVLRDAGTMTGADGTPRHVLGMRFWDIIRIRGQNTGSRYKYIYTEDNDPEAYTYERKTNFETAKDVLEETESRTGIGTAETREDVDMDTNNTLARNFLLNEGRVQEYNEFLKLTTAKQQIKYLMSKDVM
jgi:hypothetical protein